MTYSVSRHPEGITLNHKEYLLNEDQEVWVFNSAQEAKDTIGLSYLSVKEIEEKHGIYIEEKEVSDG